ncbi:MAG: hypothetical protein ACK55I_44220, partial [bacterium]
MTSWMVRRGEGSFVRSDARARASSRSADVARPAAAATSIARSALWRSSSGEASVTATDRSRNQSLAGSSDTRTSIVRAPASSLIARVMVAGGVTC